MDLHGFQKVRKAFKDLLQYEHPPKLFKVISKSIEIITKPKEKPLILVDDQLWELRSGSLFKKLQKT